MNTDRQAMQQRVFLIFSIFLFIGFTITLPRFTDTAKYFFGLLALTGLTYFIFNLSEIKILPTEKKLFFILLLINFAWIAISFYWNYEPGRSDSFLWGRHFFFLFLIPLYFLFKKINIPDHILLFSVFFSVLVSFVDICIDLGQGVDHRFQGMNPNSFGPIQLCLTGFLLFCFFFKSKKWEKYFAAAGFLLGSFTVILSQSRGAWLAIPALILFFIFYFARKYSLSRKVLVSVAIFSVLSSTYFLPIVNQQINPAVENISAYFSSNNPNDESRLGTFGSRMELWKTGWNLFLENPIMGVGVGQFKVEAIQNYQRYKVADLAKDYHYVHNQYIATLATRGVLGLIFFIILITLPICISISKKNIDRDKKIAQFSIIFICLAYIISSIPEDHFETKPAIMFIATFLALFLAKLDFDDSRQNEY